MTMLKHDNFGRLTVYDGKREFRLAVDGGLVMTTYTTSTDRSGRVWHTPHTRNLKALAPKGERIRAMILLGDGAESCD